MPTPGAAHQKVTTATIVLPPIRPTGTRPARVRLLEQCAVFPSSTLQGGIHDAGRRRLKGS